MLFLRSISKIVTSGDLKQLGPERQRRGLLPGTPLTYFIDEKGGGPIDFLGLGKTPGFFGVAKKKTEGFIGVAKKGLRDFFGHAKKSSDFFG